MFELRQEIIFLRDLEHAGCPSSTQTEIGAVAHRILRMAELLRRVREIAQRN
jgi:hypothetical protein